MNSTSYDSPNNYPNFVHSRTKPMETPLLNILHMAVGISGEAGELLDVVKKSWVYNKPLDIDNVLEELGDLVFYIQGMINVIEDYEDFPLNLDTVILLNMVKLYERYPNGYTDADAIERKDKQ